MNETTGDMVRQAGLGSVLWVRLGTARHGVAGGAGSGWDWLGVAGRTWPGRAWQGRFRYGLAGAA